MRATLLFPGDYFSLNNPNDNFTAELDAVVACDNLDPLLFNYDEYIDGSPLRLSKPASERAELLIYRGWMMKPEQYERFYDDLVNLGFDPLTEPSSYERMHCFPNAAEPEGCRFESYPGSQKLQVNPLWFAFFVGPTDTQPTFYQQIDYSSSRKVG